jgi:hypothetical protein
MTATSEGKSATAAITVQTVPPPPPAGVPDLTQLPVASGQAPNVAAYSALNVPSQPAGFSYNDPVTGVRIWKLSSATIPVANTGAGHSYADGGSEVSRGWGPGGNTHTIAILTWATDGTGVRYFLVDFTRGVGFSNYRGVSISTRVDLAMAFSNVIGQERIAYFITANQIVRYNTATNLVENTGFFPLNQTVQTWLTIDKTDTWFVGMVDGTLGPAFAWNSQTNQYLTHNETWLNEPRFERDGRYVGLTGGGGGPVRLWDLSNNTFGPTQTSTGAYSFSHIASLRSRWVDENANLAFPYGMDRFEVSGGQFTRTTVLAAGDGSEANASGNWIQSDAELGGDLNKQWYLGVGWNTDYAQFLWRQALGYGRADGSDNRLLLHHYSSLTPTYYASPWGQPSPDGKVVIFNSDMNGQSRWDLFVAEVPLR